MLSLTNTQIKVGLPGGRSGVYTVEVNVAANGDSIAGSLNSNVFKYELSMASVTPTSGSIYGGTLLTIAGVNFATDTRDTLVYIG